MTLSKSLQILRDAGFDVPPPVENYVRDRELERRGVKEVWRCNCGYVYESTTHLVDYNHGCGKSAKRTITLP